MFGEMNLAKESAKRTASVKTLTRTILIHIPQ
jgi:hypothetical protein